MKKAITLIALALTIINCKAQQDKVGRTLDEKTNTPMLVGISSKTEIQQAPFSTWFTANHDGYKPNPATIKELKKTPKAFPSLFLWELGVKTVNNKYLLFIKFWNN